MKLFKNFPNKKYNIIYADPPWTYRDKALAGNRGSGCKYSLLTMEQLKTLPIKNITADNCVLFLWVTMPQLINCFDLIKEWGFEYKTNAFTWIKKNKIKQTLFMGMGNWTRSNVELCLLSTKGKPKRIDASVHSVIETPIQKHSQKPNEARERIVKLMGDLPRIELFAREKANGWDSWGNEIETKGELE